MKKLKMTPKYYYTPSCVMGLTPRGWMAFATENEYFEYIEDEEF